jgi:hypothetical protein
MQFTRSLISAAVLLAAATAAQADIELVAVSAPITFVNDATPFATGFIDTKRFTGIADGLYSYKFTFISTDVSPFAAQFEGLALPLTTVDPFSFGSLVGTVTVAGMPLSFELAGSAASGASYTATLTLTPVPEPETYAMFLAGLGALGLIASRRQQG